MTDRESLWQKLEEKVAVLDDAEILDALKIRDRYEPEAVKIYVNEAVKRRLIHSEQDLFSSEFACKPRRSSPFPIPENSNIQRRIIRSFSRTLIIVGLIPILMGIRQISEHQLISSIVMMAVGIVWIASSLMIFIRQHRTFWIPMLILALAACVFAGRLLILNSYSKPMDYAVFIIFFGIVFYALFYLRKLLHTFNP